MSTSQIIALSAIVGAFVVFALVLAWGDYQTKDLNRTARKGADNQPAPPVEVEGPRNRATVIAAGAKKPEMA
jgi:hypothetical protein